MSSMCPVNGCCCSAAAKRAAIGVSLAGLRARYLHLADQEEVGVVGRQRAVERRLDHVARRRRPHEMRRDDDGEIGLVLLVGLRREQRPQHRHAAEPRQLLDLVMVLGLQQAADDEALAVAQFDGGGGAPHDQRRHRNVVGHRHLMGGVDLADLRLDLHVDQAVVEHGRGEGEADAVFLVGDGHLPVLAGRPGSDIRRRPGSSRCRRTAPPDWARPGCGRCPSPPAR